MFCLNVGDGLPALLDDAANAELMMLSESMPERRCGFAMVRLFARGKVVHGIQKGCEFVVAVCDGEARWSVCIERPEQKREYGCPNATPEKRAMDQPSAVGQLVGAAPMPQM